MSLTASESGGGDFEMTPEGQYIGRCYRIIDLGTQTITGVYGIQQKHKVMISWELLDEARMTDGKPFSVHGNYTVTLSENGNLRPLLESWRGKKFTLEELEGFDLNNVLGAYGIIQVVHSDDGKFANVQTIMSYKGDKPKPVNPNVVFDIDNPDMAVFNALSENMQNKITSSPEWRDNHKTAEKPEPTAAPVKPDVIAEVVEDEEIDLSSIPF